MAELQEIICSAIKNRSIVRVSYADCIRDIEPYAIGNGHVKDHVLIRAYQHKGESISGKEASWKLFRLDKMGKFVEIVDTAKEVLPEYSKGDTFMSKIIAEV
jgi:hypothetical protein